MKLLIIITLSIFSFSQSIVVSEYFNDDDEHNEWVELLVIEQNLDISNYILRDNSNDNESLAGSKGGVIFKDINLWKNLQPGTLIVITLRDNVTIPEDLDDRDGVIVVSAENPRYFDKLCENCENGSWGISVFKINSQSDLFSIFDANDNHIHQLGHSSLPVNGYNNLGTILVKGVSIGMSVAINPGANIGLYSIGKTDNEDFVKILDNPTRGKANFTSDFDQINSDFLYSLKIPDFNITNLQVISQGNLGQLVLWEKPTIQNPDYYGYLIIKGADPSLLVPSINGFYQENDITQNFEVVAVIEDFNRTSFLDDKINSQTTTYRIYPFKFKSDKPNNLNSGIGRIHNFNGFDEFLFRPEFDELFITTNDGLNNYCYETATDPQDLGITLISNIDDPSEYIFEWYNFELQDPIFAKSAFPGDKSQVNIFQTGRYVLRAYKDNVPITSNPIDITFNLKPNTLIGSEYFNIERDTTLYSCLTSPLTLTASNGVPKSDISWFKIENSIIESLNFTGFEYTITQPGKYLSISKEAECFDTSAIVTVELKSFDFQVDKNELNFLQLTNQAVSQNFILKNTGEGSQTFSSEDFIFTNSDLFTISQPSLPIILNEDEEIQVVITFNSDENVIVNDELLTIVSDCYIDDNIVLNGRRLPNEIQYDPFEIDFGSLLPCQQRNNDTTITITNNSISNLEIFNAITSQEFPIDGLPIILESEESIDLTTRFISFNLGSYNGTIEFQYRLGDDQGSFKVPVEGRVENPKINLSKSNIVFPTINNLCDVPLLDTLVLIENTGEFEVEIQDFMNDDLEFLNAPLIIPAGSASFLEIQINNTDIGEGETRVVFDFLPCNLFSEFSVSWNRVEFSSQIEPSILDFGLEYLCEDIISKTLTSTFTMSNDLGRTFTLNEINLPNNLTSNLNVNDEIFNGKEFDIYLNINQDFNDNGILNFKFDQCDISLETDYSYRVNKIEFEFPDSLIFDDTFLTESSTMQLLLANIDQDDDIYLTLDNLSDSEIFDFKLPPVPNSLYPKASEGGVYSFEISFTPDEIGETFKKIYINVESPCPYLDSIVLKGNGLPEPLPIVQLNAEIEGEDNIKLGESQQYTIRLNSTTNKPEKTKIDWVSFDLNFEPDNLDLRNFNYQIVMLDDPIVDFDISQGLYSNTLFFENVSSFENDLLLDFEALALLGDNLTTPLEIVDLQAGIVSESISYNLDSITVTISDECLLERRLIDISSNVEIKLLNDEINQNDLEISFSIVTTSPTIISIFDSNGNLIIDAVNGSLEPGSYNLTIPNKFLNSGLYFIKMKSGIAKRDLKFIQKN